MKAKYFIPLFVVCSLGLPLLHISLIGVLVSDVAPTISKIFGFSPIASIRGMGIAASFLSAFAVAFPLGFFGKRNASVYGPLLPIIGWILVFAPFRNDSLQIFKMAYMEMLALVGFCTLFWYFGQMFGQTRGKYNITPSPT